MDQQGDQKGHLRAKFPLTTLDAEIKQIRLREVSLPVPLDMKIKQEKYLFPLSLSPIELLQLRFA